MVSFTGSTNTGRCGDGRRRGDHQEGRSSNSAASPPSWSLDDADLAGACSMSAFTASMHAGRGCAITTRLVVPRTRYDEGRRGRRGHHGRNQAG